MEINYKKQFFKINKLATLALVLFSFIIFTKPSNAQVVDSSFYAWTVYELQEDELSPKQCYIVSHPIKTDSDDASRKQPYFMIARFQDQRDEEISIYGGFDYKRKGKVYVAIDDHQFEFVAGKDVAWTKNRGEDIEAIKKILRSAIIKIRSDSAIGNFAVDEYSLKGITKAYLRMKEICE